MSKEAMELLKQINAKKAQVKKLVTDGKTEEAKKAKEELIDMQERFDILCDMEDDERGKMLDKAKNGDAKQIGGEKKPEKADIIRAFVNRIVCGLRKKRMSDEDAAIMDTVSGAMNEGSDEDGGFVVPQDIQTDIIELRRAQNDLEMLVNREPVQTMSGSRVIEVDADATPWEDVDEGAKFPDAGTPQFRQIKYTIKKRGGILKTTNELLKDTAENILAYLRKWIAKKSRVTRNAAILAELDRITAGKEAALETFDDFKDVFNVKLDASITPSSVVLTNQSGFNYLDKIKDSDGKYIIQPDVTDKSKRRLFGVYPIHVVSNKVLKNGGTPDATEEYPFYIGDISEAITLFDREKITIELSTEAGDLWAKDLTGIKVRDRFDVQAVDESAVIKGKVTVNVAG